jgi:rRNA maturation endonuclease Nob1
MTLIDFLREFSDEERCKRKFKEFREQAGVVCPKCGGTTTIGRGTRSSGSESRAARRLR